MYFLFSKLLIYFLSPFFWIITLFIIAFFLKHRKPKQLTFITALLLLLVFSNGFLLSQFSAHWDIEPYPLNQKKTYSCALILGGYISEVNGSGFFNNAADRYIQAVKLKETGKVTHLLFTGGDASLTPDGFIEGNWLRAELKPFRFPDSTLLFEKQSRNTIENIRFSKAMLEARHLPPPYLLVTSAFHMRRTLLICKKAGLQVVPFPCNLSPARSAVFIDDFIPSGETLSGWNTYLKEMVGYLVTSFKH